MSTASVTYRYSPVPFTSVQVDDGFWSPRLETNRSVTVPYDFRKCEETGRIANFDKASGALAGDHEGIFYNDSDVYKIVEGAAYSLALRPDPDLDAYLDDLIARIAAAQEPDGYLYTARTIAERNGTVDRLPDNREGKARWSNLRVNHELYNVGHLYEAAVAHFRATGKRSLLDVAQKNADLIASVFGPGRRYDVPGHQEIEMGLVKLYQVTGEDRYLHLAKFFLDERGHTHGGRSLYSNHENPGYMQDHLPVVEQREAVGHAVRAAYMYCGMADVAAHTGAGAYVTAIDRIWDNVVGRKLYITGGIGARHQGEAFGEDYELPNHTAYAETCAAIANAMWNHRMFLLHGDAKYMDVVERIIYNGFLSGVALNGDRFFYVNPLAWDGKLGFNRGDSRRQPWFDCSCCPSNVVRFLPSLPGYAYACEGDNVYVNLFMGGEATIPLSGGDVRLRQSSAYPWQGRVELSVEPGRANRRFALRVRIPGWALDRPVPSRLYSYVDKSAPPPNLLVNGEVWPLMLDQGYAVIERTWQPGDVVVLDLPMPVRRAGTHLAAFDNWLRVAVERGPVVYCAEAEDHVRPIDEMALPDDAMFRIEHRSDFLGGATVLSAPAIDGSLTLIPYHLWAHRQPGEMAVWLRRAT